MVRNNITRWHPHTCGCVIETVAVYDDNNEQILEPPRFLLMNEVCDKHAHLASTKHGERHKEMATNVMNIIDEVKVRNTKQIDHALEKSKREIHKRDLMACKNTVNQFNDRLTEEWSELTSLLHAFDEHIYQQILKEQPVQENG